MAETADLNETCILPLVGLQQVEVPHQWSWNALQKLTTKMYLRHIHANGSNLVLLSNLNDYIFTSEHQLVLIRIEKSSLRAALFQFCLS